MAAMSSLGLMGALGRGTATGTVNRKRRPWDALLERNGIDPMAGLQRRMTDAPPVPAPLEGAQPATSKGSIIADAISAFPSRKRRRTPIVGMV